MDFPKDFTMSSRETHGILWAKLFDIVWSPEVSEWAVRNEKTKEMEVRNSGSNRKCGIECRCSPGCGHGDRMERFSAVAFETSKLNAHDLNMIEPFEPYISRCFCYFLVLSTLRGHLGLHVTFVGIHRDGKRTLAGRTRSQRNPLGGCLRRACPWSLQYALGTLRCVVLWMRKMSHPK